MKKVLSFIISMLLIFSTVPTTIAFADSSVTFEDPVLQSYMCTWVGKAQGSTIYLSDLTAHAGNPIVIPQGASTLAGMESLAGLTIPQIIIQQGTISDLTPIKDIKGVLNLAILHNNVSDIAPLSGYTSLQQVQLMWNNIASISVVSNWAAIQNLDLSYNNVSDISSLSGLTTLQYLKVRHNNISDISPVTNLTALFQLDIQENNISSLAPVSNLTNMQSLSFDHNQISNITPLQGITSLDYLSMSDNNITSITPLTNITKITILYANRIGFSNLTPLVNSTQLQILQVDGNEITDISPLAGLTTLQELSVNSNQISDITPVKNLTNLNTFWAWGNQIIDISPIANLTGLQSLQLMSNKITDISAINNLVNIQMLNLGDNRITDFAPITHISNISQYTYLNDNYSNIFSGAIKSYIDGISVTKVTTPQHKLFVNKNSINLTEGSTDTLLYNVADTTDGTLTTPSNYLPINSGSNIVLTSREPSVATIDQNGNIHAEAAGNTIITAELFGINAEYTRQDITVNVSAAPKGSITIKYQDENGSNIQAPDILYNLAFGIYTENAKTFIGFSLNDSVSKSVTLTKLAPNQTIIFRYKKDVVHPITKGNYTVQFVDQDGNILEQETTSSLDLGSYTIQAKNFDDYILNDERSKNVILSIDNSNQTIVFKYKKSEVANPVIKGSITIKYQDEAGKDVIAPEILSKLDLRSYTENAKNFDGYTLDGEKNQSVILTENNKDQVIIFKYKKDTTSIVPGMPVITKLPQTGSPLDDKMLVLIGLFMIILGSYLTKFKFTRNK